MARFNKFLKALRNSPSMEVAVMCGLAAVDVQTTTGSNRNLLERVHGLNMTTMGAAKVKQVLEERLPAVPDRDKWRLAYLGKLLEREVKLTILDVRMEI